MTNFNVKAFRREMKLKPINALFAYSPFAVARNLAGGVLFAGAFFLIFTVAGIFN